jgi:hypothetical protein
VAAEATITVTSRTPERTLDQLLDDAIDIWGNDLLADDWELEVERDPCFVVNPTKKTQEIYKRQQGRFQRTGQKLLVRACAHVCVCVTVCVCAHLAECMPQASHVFIYVRKSVTGLMCSGVFGITAFFYMVRSI